MKKIVFNILWESIPFLLSSTGAILIAFSLRVIDPLKGIASISIYEKQLLIPQQNIKLFNIGLFVFILGVLIEFVTIIRRNLKQ